jgi:peptidoglycan hydrolase-like protein with peptidoglycan-binding domain
LTASAVGAFQATKGIIVDGQVGPQTAKRLKIDLSAA